MTAVSYYDIPFNREETFRYAGCKLPGEGERELLSECLDMIKDRLSYKACYDIFNISVRGDICDFGAFSVRSKDLAKNLSGCKKAVLFAATLGVGVDRLIARYSALSPSKALMFDAIGNAQIEELCDRLCEEIKEEQGGSVKPRFSAGYGDLDISFQKTVFSLLDCQRAIGLTLNDSMLMSPTKSVTAIMGLY